MKSKENEIYQDFLQLSSITTPSYVISNNDIFSVKDLYTRVLYHKCFVIVLQRPSPSVRWK